MIGGSIGIRTASYGSLQQQAYSNGPAFPTIQPTPVPAVRKPSKMLLAGAREKERLLPWICKVASRRKVGMLLLLVASVAVLLSFISVVNRDDESPVGPKPNMSISDPVWNFESRDAALLSNPSPPLVPVNENEVNAASSSKQMSVSDDDGIKLVVPGVRPGITLTHHPCENFSLPPPPQEPKRIGPRPCPVCYAPLELAIALMPTSPSVLPILKHLSYVSEENLIANESRGGSVFGGYPSLEQRDESFDIKESMNVHCGFVKGKKPGQGTGFDINDADLLEMEQCHGVVVASAIFGNYDIMQQPKNISEVAKRSACFYMFVDEETAAYIKNTSTLDSTNRVGLWRVVVVHSLPYVDARRNGKVPKLLLHRLFPNARFSLWIDGKLELVVDPYQVLERFLWRQNATFAISRHYRRFDVFVEAEANKAAGKYDLASIDYQIEFYKREGLTPYSRAKLPITSDVPEGCVIIREHTPITNLFTCLWFNEVDRFTSRDQLSFSTVRDKIMSKVNWTVNMFLDCERRNFVVQAYHRDLLERRKSLASSYPPPRLSTNESPGKLVAGTVPERIAKTPPRSVPERIARTPPRRHGKDRKSSSRRRHPRATS